MPKKTKKKHFYYRINRGPVSRLELREYIAANSYEKEIEMQAVYYREEEAFDTLYPCSVQFDIVEHQLSQSD